MCSNSLTLFFFKHSPPAVVLVAEELPQPIPDCPAQRTAEWKDRSTVREREVQGNAKEGRKTEWRTALLCHTNSLAHLLSLSLEQSALAQRGTHRAEEQEASGGRRGREMLFSHTIRSSLPPRQGCYGNRG
ncbi:uncharacterized [Tachysurus ichikawai]